LRLGIQGRKKMQIAATLTLLSLTKFHIVGRFGFMFPLQMFANKIHST
jgi:hypothetical protein